MWSVFHLELNGLLSEMSIIFKCLGSPDVCYVVDKLSTTGGAHLDPRISQNVTFKIAFVLQ